MTCSCPQGRGKLPARAPQVNERRASRPGAALARLPLPALDTASPAEEVALVPLVTQVVSGNPAAHPCDMLALLVRERALDGGKIADAAIERARPSVNGAP
ncbi:MAG: hypothetical protein NVS4B10_06300 [Myxococcales bacterium]